MLPPPPYTFPGASVLYQPKLVRASAARRVTPPGVFLLSLAGWTLGGTFCVDWTSSPIGPYREVAVLSGLVVRGGTAGAWASHIIVTSPDAVDAGREFWGLPAVAGVVEFEPRASEDAAPSIEFVDNRRVVVRGMPTAADAAGIGATAGLATESRRPRWQLTLPSLSGALPMAAERGAPSSPLLRYPLVLSAGSAGSVRLRRRAHTRLGSGVTDPGLRALLDEGSPASPCVEAVGLRVTAGEAEEIEGSRSGDGAKEEEGALSVPLMVLDGGVLVIYGLLSAIGNGVAAGELLRPPVATATDVVEIAYALDVCTAHALAWSLAAALSGAARDSWLRLSDEEHASAPLGVARLVRTWLLQLPLYEALRASVRWSFAVDPAVPPLAELSTEALATLALMCLWRKLVLQRLWWLR